MISVLENVNIEEVIMTIKEIKDNFSLTEELYEVKAEKLKSVKQVSQVNN